MLTARDAVEDRIEGLDAGADDYLVKPFAFDELLARLRALARRGAAASGRSCSRSATCASIPQRRRAWRGETELELSAKEFALLEVFMRRPGEALSRVQLLDGAWDMAFESRSNVVDVYVRYLREKIDRPFGRRVARDRARRRLPAPRGRRREPAPDPRPADAAVRARDGRRARRARRCSSTCGSATRCSVTSTRALRASAGEALSTSAASAGAARPRRRRSSDDAEHSARRRTDGDRLVDPPDLPAVARGGAARPRRGGPASRCTSGRPGPGRKLAPARRARPVGGEVASSSRPLASAPRRDRSTGCATSC